MMSCALTRRRCNRRLLRSNIYCSSNRCSIARYIVRFIFHGTITRQTMHLESWSDWILESSCTNSTRIPPQHTEHRTIFELKLQLSIITPGGKEPRQRGSWWTRAVQARYPGNFFVAYLEQRFSKVERATCCITCSSLGRSYYNCFHIVSRVLGFYL